MTYRVSTKLVEEIHNKLAHNLLLVEEAETERLETVKVGRQHRQQLEHRSSASSSPAERLAPYLCDLLVCMHTLRDATEDRLGLAVRDHLGVSQPRKLVYKIKALNRFRGQHVRAILLQSISCRRIRANEGGKETTKTRTACRSL